MSSTPSNRLMGWQLVNLAIYPNAPGAQNIAGLAVVTGSDLLAVYTGCHLRISDKAVDSRATWEDWDDEDPISSRWSVEMGAVVDGTMPQLIYIRTHYGRGPYIVYMRNAQGYDWCGRANIREVDWNAPMEAAQSEGLMLVGRGRLFEGHAVT